jgi:hypothetical protein
MSDCPYCYAQPGNGMAECRWCECTRLRAEVETLRAERDDAKSAIVLTCERYHEKVAALEADRDAWKAKAEARPEISPEDAARLDVHAHNIARSYKPSDLDAAERVVAALRVHAGKAVTR